MKLELSTATIEAAKAAVTAKGIDMRAAYDMFAAWLARDVVAQAGENDLGAATVRRRWKRNPTDSIERPRPPQPLPEAAPPEVTTEPYHPLCDDCLNPKPCCCAITTAAMDDVFDREEPSHDAVRDAEYEDIRVNLARQAEEHAAECARLRGETADIENKLEDVMVKLNNLREEHAKEREADRAKIAELEETVEALEITAKVDWQAKWSREAERAKEAVRERDEAKESATKWAVASGQHQAEASANAQAVRDLERVRWLAKLIGIRRITESYDEAWNELRRLLGLT